MLVKFLSTSPLTEKSRLSDVLEKSWKSWYLERGSCHTIDRCTEEKKKEKRHKKNDGKCRPGNFLSQTGNSSCDQLPEEKMAFAWLFCGAFPGHWI